MAQFPSIQEFRSLAHSLQALAEMEDVLGAAAAANPWFTPGMIRHAVQKMVPWFSEANYLQLIAQYGKLGRTSGTLGLIMAGNIPLVGFHDLLMGWLAGYRIRVKLSSKDNVLLPALLPLLPRDFGEAIIMGNSPDESEIDRLIATGSDNSARFFAHAYQHVPALVRKNRFSAAVIRGDENDLELAALAGDILQYAGAGCRNVSNVFVPSGYDFSALIEALENWKGEVSPAYETLLRWEKALARTMKTDLMPNGRVVIMPMDDLGPTRLGVVHSLAYTQDKVWKKLLADRAEKLQCVVGRGLPIGFGQTQSPGLLDFADGADTLRWLLEPQERT